jgi:hypothetical protein
MDSISLSDHDCRREAHHRLAGRLERRTLRGSD